MSVHRKASYDIRENIFDKELYQEYIKNSYKSITQRHTTQFKMGKTLRHVTKENIMMDSKQNHLGNVN